MSTKTIMKVAGAIAAIAVVAACSSFPEPASDADAILIIPLKVSVESGAPTFGYFNMNIQAVSGGPMLSFGMSPYGAYSMIKGLKEGSYKLVSVQFRYTDGQMGQAYPIDRTVLLEGRSITIVPLAFSYRLYQEGRRFVMAAGWADLTTDVADKLARALASDEKVKAWRFSGDTLLNPYLRQALQNAGLQ